MVRRTRAICTIGPTVLICIAALLAVPPVWSQEAGEDEGEEDTVTITWGSEDEEDTARDGFLGGIGGGNDEAPAEPEPPVRGMELPTLQYSAGAALGLGLTSTVTTTSTGQETDSTLNVPLVATGSVRYALASPLLGDAFNAGAGRQLGALVSLGTDARANVMAAFVDFRSNTGQLGGYFAGGGVTFGGSLALLYGLHLREDLLMTVLTTIGTGGSGDTSELDLVTLVGFEYVF